MFGPDSIRTRLEMSGIIRAKLLLNKTNVANLPQVFQDRPFPKILKYVVVAVVNVVIAAVIKHFSQGVLHNYDYEGLLDFSVDSNFADASFVN